MTEICTEGVYLNCEMVLDYFGKREDVTTVSSNPESTDSIDVRDVPIMYSCQSVRNLTAAVAISLGRLFFDSRDSAQVHPVWIGMVRQLHDEEVAEFFEPVRFNWNSQQYKIRQAVREFSEATDANH